MHKLSHSYIDLGEKFFNRTSPEKVASPSLLLWNKKLAEQLNFFSELQLGSTGENSLLAQYFSGNKELNGANSIALAYSGHQFGHFNPQLGDGRAHLLGEILDAKGMRFDIQLKGSGRTAFSRRGDGKCALAPALREYIMSEAMFALGVPTSRCLAVVSTGELINRGTTKAGAVVTRIASSHIRVGTFQYFAARGDLVSLKSLLDYTIERHFPEINSPEIKSLEVNTIIPSNENTFQKEPILAFLEKVLDKQITLIVSWLKVGFIHGVMNTDNTAICGETIDFGPCAMLGVYDENAVFSSIDEYGRYAFSNQAKIAQWNMARLADCLLPLLIDSSEDPSNLKDQEQKALKNVEAVINQYNHKFDKAYYAMYANKLGMANVSATSKELINDLLSIMQVNKLDYTQTFYNLTQSLKCEESAKVSVNELGKWFESWLDALDSDVLNGSKAQQRYSEAYVLMSQNNPVVIPRNHHIENILARCEDVAASSSQLEKSETVNQIVSEFLTVLQSPYEELESTNKFQDTPEDSDRYYQTFCGT